MFERIKSIFSKKPEEKEQRKLTIEEAEKLYNEEMEKRNSQAMEKCRPLESGVKARFSTLHELFMALRNADIHEERAMSSKAVKDKFAEKATEILSGMKLPETSTVEDVKHFAFYASDLLDRLDITPKQAMHIQFFFGEHVSKIMAEVEQMIGEIKILKDVIEPVLKEKAAIEGIFFEIKMANHSIEKNEERAREVLDEIVELKKIRDSYALNDISELEKLREQLRQLAQRRNEFRERINSDFVPVSRLLKKYHYHEQFALRSNEKLVEMYIKEPYDAFLSDEELKVRKFLEEAATLAATGEIDIDVKTVQKLDSLIDSLDKLAEMRETDREIKQQMSELEENIMKNWLPKAEHNKSIERQVVSVSNEIAELEKNHIKTLDRIKESNGKLSEFSQKLQESLSKFTGQILVLEIKKE